MKWLNTKAVQIVFLLFLLGAITRVAFYYHARYQEAHEQLLQQQKALKEMQNHIEEIAALDEKYLTQLRTAQQSVSQLGRDVAAGKRRLQLAASCGASPTGTTGVDDAARARLDDAAQRHYFTLRERIATAVIQIAGLQEYIRQQCLK